MPEIWLGYGSTNVVVDIKIENLNEVSKKFTYLTESFIDETLSNFNGLKDNTLIFALSPSKASSYIITKIMNIGKERGIELKIATWPIFQSTLKRNMLLYSGNNQVLQITEFEFLEKIKKYDNVILISRITFDPLFGYNGAPTTILRECENKIMFDALESRAQDLPRPGIINPSTKIAMEYFERIDTNSIEIISDYQGIIGIHYGEKSNQVFQNAIDKLQNTIINKSDLVKSIILSAGSEIEQHLTLTRSLYSLWNNIHLLKNDGTVIMFSENSKGIGKGALKMLLEGRIKFNEICKVKQYYHGLEHLIFLNTIRERYKIGVVSSIPHYYIKTKLNFEVYNNGKEVINTLLTRYGKNSKITIDTNPEITLSIIK